MGSRHDLSSQHVLILFYFFHFNLTEEKWKGRAYYEADPVFKFLPVMSSSNLQGWGILSY